MDTVIQFRIKDRVDYRPLGESAWIGATIDSIVEKEEAPYLTIVTDSYMVVEKDGSHTDRACVRWEDVFQHIAVAGTHVKEDWRSSFLHLPHPNPYIEFLDPEIGSYRLGKMVHYCSQSDRVCIIFYRYRGAEMECICLPFHSKKLRCPWDFME
jgi:hypothetical protein